MSLIHREKTQDLRVRRTHVLLRKALWELMTEQEFQSITVQDIADHAMINRATFYDHFMDKYALLDYAIREQFKETLGAKLPEGSTFTAENLALLLRTTGEYLLALRHGCKPKDHQLLPMVQTQITIAIGEILTDWIKGLRTSRSVDAALVATMTSWAIYGAAVYWSQQPDPDSPESFVAQTLPTILASLQQISNAPLSR
ncbi:MAG TPA: TetR family transcriptional regulator [Aggregatilineales bacterium]|nr:TetR family transcriptional regulator [Aggregatilineales bacterium]